MNILLRNCFKNSCNGQLKELIDLCYLSLKELHFPQEQDKDSILVCGIYCPPHLTEELFAYQQELETLGSKFQIDRIYILEVETIDLHYFREQAGMNDNVEAWRTYLEMQYLF